MTTGPDGERRQEPTFADVMNGFGLDSGRPLRRRLFGRRRDGGSGRRRAARHDAPGAASRRSGRAATPYDRLRRPSGAGAPRPRPRPGPRPTTAREPPRPSARTRGRGAGPSPGSTSRSRRWCPPARAAGRRWRHLQVEHRAVAELCEQTRSVAEVAALLSLPLGVARVRARRHGRAGCGDRAPDREQRRQRAGPRIDGKGVEWTPSALVTCRGSGPDPAGFRGAATGPHRSPRRRRSRPRSWWPGASASARPRSSARSRRSCR